MRGKRFRSIGEGKKRVRQKTRASMCESIRCPFVRRQARQKISDSHRTLNVCRDATLPRENRCGRRWPMPGFFATSCITYGACRAGCSRPRPRSCRRSRARDARFASTKSSTRASTAGSLVAAAPCRQLEAPRPTDIVPHTTYVYIIKSCSSCLSVCVSVCLPYFSKTCRPISMKHSIVHMGHR